MRQLAFAASALRARAAGWARSSAKGVRRAFTTVELLIVIGTLVLLLAMAVPAFNYIMGNRSLQAAENIVSAMLGRARGYAIANQAYAGIAVFYNPTTERTTLAMVIQTLPGGSGTEDPYQNYKGWSSISTGGTTTYGGGAEVIDAVADNIERKVVVRNYFCKPPGHTSSPTTAPPSVGYWGAGSSTSTGSIDILADSDLEPLPPGVGCELINSPEVPALVPDRYVHTGVIMFDPNGALANVPVLILPGSQLAALAEGQIDPTLQVMIPANPVVNAKGYFRSQVGVALFGRDEFLAAGGKDPQFIQGLAEDQCLMATPDPSAPNFQSQEDWLDRNSTVLMVSRYNGTLIKGE